MSKGPISLQIPPLLAERIILFDLGQFSRPVAVLPAGALDNPAAHSYRSELPLWLRHAPTGRHVTTNVMDLQSDPNFWVGTGFDYVHYHVPKAALDDIARDHGMEPAGSYKFAICEHDIVLAQLMQCVLPLIHSRGWTGSPALDQVN